MRYSSLRRLRLRRECVECTWALLHPTAPRTFATSASLRDGRPSEKFTKQRIRALGGDEALSKVFPRWREPEGSKALTAAQFLGVHAERSKNKEQDISDGKATTVYGRVTSRRKQGSLLMFIDLESGGKLLQVVLNYHELKAFDGDQAAYQNFRRKFRRGDWLCVTGELHTTRTGQASILARNLPQIVSASLQPLPEAISDVEFLSRNRHVERILDSTSRDALVLRHRLLARLRAFFTHRNFIEVSTPLLTAGFGGAVARPFETTASEFPDVKLNLRIAPELWLKRLIVGNLERIFEIGPAFRNEGVDSTHNPEFSICEFYQTMTDLEQLISMTEDLFKELRDESHDARDGLISIPDPTFLELGAQFRRLSFIPALESAIRKKLEGWCFPDLDGDSAAECLVQALRAFGLSSPPHKHPSIPKLLDTLSSELIEQDIQKPTWILNHPECMSPLAKSFRSEPDQISGRIHKISARAELFIQGKEYVNCYEEENSPVEQRRKFEDQIRHRNVEAEATVDESYVKVLEWGMPPTGGWGCGIDRLVMLFSGRTRIADVLPFGTLTNVAGLGSPVTRGSLVTENNP